ncbi:MAG: DUF2851 family protein [Bacteroidota bacterium]|nr:DUF2851 family protein [Bacteroidota bacterium]
MNEDFLSFVWKYRLYHSDLKTTSGIPVTVIKPGEQHTNSGPDFFNARIRIGDTLWAGNVEIHVRASDWYRHQHQTDKAYDNVILHVVYEADSDIIMGDMTTVPTVSLCEQTDPVVIKQYRNLRTSPNNIPCGSQLSVVPEVIFNSWSDRMLVERLEHKSVQIELALHVNKGDWEDAFYQLLARNFGFHVNAGPFEMLARCLPRTLLLRHADQLHQVEALVFGQSGLLLEPFKDEYPSLLQNEYRFLSKKYGLMPLDHHIWKLLRMRPANFPTIRLSQFARLISENKCTMQRLLSEPSAEIIMKNFHVSASPYWNNHYLFDKPTRYRSAGLGDTSIRNILINTIAPVMFYYGRIKGEEMACEQAFSLLKNLPPEQNHILDEWLGNGIKVESAYTGQAMLGLYNNYCSQKKCLNCSLGITILNKQHEHAG